MSRDWQPSMRAEKWLGGLSLPEEEHDDAWHLASILRSDYTLDPCLYNALCAATMPFRGREEKGPEPIKLINDKGDLVTYEHTINVRLALTARKSGRPAEGIRSVVQQQNFMKALGLKAWPPIRDMPRPPNASHLRTLNLRLFHWLVGAQIQSDRQLRNAIAELVDPATTSPWRLRIEPRAKRPRGGQRHTDLGQALRELFASHNSKYSTSSEKGHNRFDKKQMADAKEKSGRGEKTIRTRVRKGQKRIAKEI